MPLIFLSVSSSNSVYSVVKICNYLLAFTSAPLWLIRPIRRKQIPEAIEQIPMPHRLRQQRHRQRE